MRQPRVAAALAVLALGLAGVVAASLAGRDDGGAGTSELAWKGQPEVLPAPNLPRDGIATGHVRNETLRRVELEASDLVVVDDRGRRWRTAGRFMTGFAHGLWPPGQEVAPGSEAERERLGVIAPLEPGQVAPLTVAWTKPPGGGRPVSIDLGGPTLPIPLQQPGL